MIYFTIFFPVVAGFIAVFLTDEHKSEWNIVATGVTFLAMLITAIFDYGKVFTLPVVHLYFSLGGFNCIYGVIVSFMWLISAIITLQYFWGHRHMSRYFFFYLVCLSSTLGVFLSGELYTTFMFFEMMSLGSYVWVAQEETPEAFSAGKTYLTIAVLGGLVTLMGLMILNHLTGTMVISELKDACAAVEDRSALWAAALCIFFGFAAKAGAFPLHIWLPKAHPVAPAPASALLSGVLTKAGIFGIIVITANILIDNTAWGILLLIIGCITMVLGALMGIFSNNLKYILACSSLSQIGFILIGVSMSCLLGEHNAMASNGAFLYMMNHSLVKLTLFLFSGIVFFNTKKLDLNDLKGFGRHKPLLHVLFLFGSLSLAGIPGFCGYLSKTLIHESIVEYAELTGNFGITCVEWLFLLSGGMTLVYLLKIYIAIFWEKGKKYPDAWGTPLTKIGLGLAAISLPLIGIFPYQIAEYLMSLTISFTAGHQLENVQYFSLENLKGVAISVTIGIVIYLVLVRKILLKNGRYRNVIPESFRMETMVYLPLLHALTAVLSFVCRCFCDVTDGFVLLMKKSVLKNVADERTVKNTENGISPLRQKWDAALDLWTRLSGTLSYALLMTCFGVCVILCVVMFHVFV